MIMIYLMLTDRHILGDIINLLYFPTSGIPYRVRDYEKCWINFDVETFHISVRDKILKYV